MNPIAKVWPSPQARHEALRIGGEKIRRAEIIEVFNPYNGELVGTVPKATLADVRHAFAWAHQYRARLTRYERSQILLRAADKVHQRTEEIADLITFTGGVQIGKYIASKMGYRRAVLELGGIKDSGLGYKEGVQEAMKSFTNVKTYSLPWD